MAENPPVCSGRGIYFVHTIMYIVIIFLLGIFLDLAFGDPPNAWHPVAWLGKLISWEFKYFPARSAWQNFAFGTVMVLLTIVIITSAIYFLIHYMQEKNQWFWVIISAILLKFCFSLRGLRTAATEIQRNLITNNLLKSRYKLTTLVSRDTNNLVKSKIVAATVESLAENSCDSFIAPIFYFLLFGIPGAIAYRIINTFDSMIGYHDKYEHSGKFAARVDDIVNFIPARITAFILLLSAWICRQNIAGAWHIMLRDHAKTESPNAGWTMSAVAGALGVQLEKIGHYKLGDMRRPLSVGMIDITLHMIAVTAVIWILITILLLQGWSYVAS